MGSKPGDYGQSVTLMQSAQRVAELERQLAEAKAAGVNSRYERYEAYPVVADE